MDNITIYRTLCKINSALKLNLKDLFYIILLELLTYFLLKKRN